MCTRYDKSFSLINTLGSIGFLALGIVYASIQSKFPELWVPMTSVAVFHDTTYHMYEKHIVYLSGWMSRGWLLAVSSWFMFLGTMVTAVHCWYHYKKASSIQSNQSQQHMVPAFLASILRYTKLSVRGVRLWMYSYTAAPLALVSLVFFSSFDINNYMDLFMIASLIFVGVLSLVFINELIVYGTTTIKSEDKISAFRAMFMDMQLLVVHWVISVMIVIDFLVLIAPLFPVFVNLPTYAHLIDGKLWTSFAFYLIWVSFMTFPITVRRFIGFDPDTKSFNRSHGVYIETLFVFVPLVVLVIFGTTIIRTNVSSNYIQAFIDWVQ